jgi:phosphonate metabolism protein PhnN/1,5-bisphosphokinase (PRPP-forming)
MAGVLVLVVGPSGAGKDALIAAARNALTDDPRFVFPRRKVTRQAVAALEDHDTMSWEEFAAGAFALSWEAHGLGYALPASIDDDLADDRIVVANVSRQVLAGAARRYPIRIVLITANPAIRASRLAARGRETETEIAARLAREGAEVPAGIAPVTVIDNSGPLSTAASAFVAALSDISASA